MATARRCMQWSAWGLTCSRGSWSGRKQCGSSTPRWMAWAPGCRCGANQGFWESGYRGVPVRAKRINRHNCKLALHMCTATSRLHACVRPIPRRQQGSSIALGTQGPRQYVTQQHVQEYARCLPPPWPLSSPGAPATHWCACRAVAYGLGLGYPSTSGFRPTHLQHREYESS
jgi:hypothetical protein